MTAKKEAWWRRCPPLPPRFFVVTTDPELQAAISTVARGVLCDMARKAEHEDYPEIGEHDWQRILDLLDALARGPRAA